MRVSGSFLFDTAAQPNQAQPCRGRPWPGLGRPTAFQRTCSKFEECTFRPTCPATRPSPAQQPSPAQNKTSPAWAGRPWPSAHPGRPPETAKIVFQPICRKFAGFTFGLSRPAGSRICCKFAGLTFGLSQSAFQRTFQRLAQPKLTRKEERRQTQRICSKFGCGKP